MGMYSITGWSGGGRRPLTYNLKAGQFRGMGRVNVVPSQTTIINNNVVGGGYGVYTDTHCCNNSTPKWMKWMMGLGIGSTLLGGILNMFGVGGNSNTAEANAAPMNQPTQEPETRTQQEPNKMDQARKTLDSLGMTKDNGYTVSVDEDGKITYHYNKDGINVEADNITDLIDQINKAKAASPSENVEEEVPSVDTTPEESDTKTKQDYSNIKNGAMMVCSDASGKTSSIQGTLSNVQTDAKGVPQSFILTDSTSGNQYQYEVRVGSDGTLAYECVTKNGQATIGAPTYTLKDGQLINEQNQNGYSQGIRTQSAPPTTPTHTTKIETTADGESVSDTPTFITPYKHSDGKYYSKEEEYKAPWQ